MPLRSTIPEMLYDPRSTEPALVAVEPEAVITYRELAGQVDALAGRLLGGRIQSGERVALVLQNGVEFLVAFLAIVRARLVAAPLNPALKAEELEFLLNDARAGAVVAAADDAVVARAASNAGVPVLTIRRDAGGEVDIGGLPAARSDPAPPSPEDIALFLHTSGTTNRPKAVPLSHANVTFSAHNTADHYRLGPADRTLLVMPLFHVHGLIGAALSTLASGGAVIVTRRFSASAFWPAAIRLRATWYSAVPTIHQVLLLRAEREAPAKSGMRFIRSSSAALAPATLEHLERRFGAPVLEAYGMTEAAHQVTANPLPPHPHKPGTAGMGGRVEVAVMDEAGRMVGAGAEGEVVVRGPNVMRGYYENPQANAEAFVGGWFRTGDRGVLDADSYLKLVGRIKELINRGGEKIAPTEVDAALLSHPAVAEAAAFGVPDPKYGEEVWAAVVLRHEVGCEELRAHCLELIADFKTPKVIRIVSELPKGITGKVERRRLAALLGPAAS